ncbi:MAG: SPOR domain-containing protein, partial [Sinomicrobium sp.]|nr:SPOR domain-containing protein [Sinomicrobium sp.]
SSNVQFRPSEQVNYLASSFGLVPVLHHKIIRETLKQEVAALEATVPLHFTPEKRRNRAYLRYAAVFLLTIAAGTVGYRMVKDNRVQQYETVRQEARQEVEKTIQQATFFNADPATLPSVTLHLDKVDKAPLKYHVVGGAFRIEANAEKKIAELAAKGYNARSVGVNRYGLHIVAYGSFAGADEALAFLKTVRTTEITEAWLWVSQ